MSKSWGVCVVIALGALGCPQERSAPPPPVNAAAATALGAGQRANIRSTMSNIKKACTQFNAKEGTWPEDMQALIDSGDWLEQDRADPWGNDYVIEVEGNSLEVATYGADGEPGGEDADADFSTADAR